ncbi:MAG: hypothetical protein VB071_04935 [Lawsonibacter sp.]|nr:hypothetical protein [Lawsonibacter sp.]
MDGTPVSNMLILLVTEPVNRMQVFQSGLESAVETAEGRSGAGTCCRCAGRVLYAMPMSDVMAFAASIIVVAHTNQQLKRDILEEEQQKM